MTSALFDTNVVLDLLLNRGPWATEVSLLMEAVQRGEVRACISASAITDIFYLCRKSLGLAGARLAIERCLTVFDVLAVDERLIVDAFALPITDLEDAVQSACAAREGLDLIVTRDEAGFTLSKIPAYSPAAFLTKLGQPAAPVPQTP